MVDAIAGGGGLLTLPTLLAVGLPPHLALGTNKGASMFGSGAALFRFARAGLVSAPRARISFPMGLLGAFAGAALVLVVKPTVLRPLVLGLLVVAALIVSFRPPTVIAADATPREPRPSDGWVTALIAFGIGAYDGFFGPGTGTFLILAFVGALGDTLRKGSANAKVVNFASNVGAAVLFAMRGVVLWNLALPMAAAQFLGGFTGAHLAVKGGDKVVRWVVLAVVACLVLKLGHDFWVDR
jgi:uncharacterized protein